MTGIKHRTSTDVDDPRWLPVQLQIRVPFWYRQQLQAEAARLGTSVPTMIVDAVERAYKPAPPA